MQKQTNKHPLICIFYVLQYLEKRFGKIVRTAGSMTFVVQMVGIINKYETLTPKLIDSALCTFCGQEDETIRHLVWH